MNPEWVVEGLEASLDKFALGPVDLTLTPGRAVAVLGPSGAGKTTLLRALAGFLPLKRGRILRDGTDISAWLPEERSLGYVPQGLGLFPHKTVAGNIRYPLELRERPDAKERTEELLDKFHLLPLAGRYPSRLSGGELQRVAIARALAADPALILWDEPWQGLDVVARHELGTLLQELLEAEKVPVVLVTHDPALAFSIAETFLVLTGGRVREQSDAMTLLRAPGDPFSARFVGFDNVFETADLEGGPSGSLRAWLRSRSGTEGVAFATPTLVSDAAPGPTWVGKVRSARPTPHGVDLEVVADSLRLTVRVPPPLTLPLPLAGTSVRLTIDTTSLLSLGAESHAPRGPEPSSTGGAISSLTSEGASP